LFSVRNFCVWVLTHQKK